MKRREILKWTAPVVTAVILPAHATTSENEIVDIVGIPPAPPENLPDTELPLRDPCEGEEVPVCYDVPGNPDVQTLRTLCKSPEEAADLVANNPLFTEGTCEGATAFK